MNSDLLAMKLARLEGLAIGMQERLEDGKSITQAGARRLTDLVREITELARVGE